MAAKLKVLACYAIGSGIRFNHLQDIQLNNSLSFSHSMAQYSK